jgi:hypothetical protein
MARKNDETTARPVNDAYTGMLALSLIALLVGSTLLYLDYAQYPDKAPSKVSVAFKARPDFEQGDVKPAPAPEKKADEPGEEGKDEKKDAPKDNPEKK